MDAFAILAEPKRRTMLELIWSDEMSAGEIAGHFDVTFGAVSQHLALLRDAGLVTVRRDGRHRYYRAHASGFGPLRPMLEAMWGAKLDQLATAIEEGA